MYVGLGYTAFPVAFSSAVMFFYKYSYKDSQCTLIRLESCGVVMHFVLCYTWLSKMFNLKSR